VSRSPSAIAELLVYIYSDNTTQNLWQTDMHLGIPPSLLQYVDLIISMSHVFQIFKNFYYICRVFTYLNVLKLLFEHFHRATQLC